MTVIQVIGIEQLGTMKIGNKGTTMKKSIFITSIFSAGIVFGAVASEIAENGLYLFNSGDPILASEVNANFDYLLQKITILEAKLASYESNGTLDPVIGSWSCVAGDGTSGFIVFRDGGGYSESGVSIFNGWASAWARAAEGVYIITGNGQNTSNITFSNNNYNMHVVPDRNYLDTLDCTKS